MPKRTPPAIRIVLDTSCVRGTPRPAILALMRRGFQISISGLALSEFAVYFASDTPAETSAKQQKVLRPRMKFFTDLFGGAVPLAPTHAPLVHKLRGRMVGRREDPYPLWLDTVQSMWKELAGDGPVSLDIASRVDGTVAYVHQTGADFVETSGAAADLGEVTDEDIRLAKRFSSLLPNVLNYMRLPPPISSADRFDAYTRLLAQLPQLRGCRSILSSTYERKLALHPDAKWDPEAFG